MTRFITAHASAPDWGQACRACLDQLDAVPPGTNLGILFVNDSFAPHLGSILTLMREITKIEDWVGAAGAAICAGKGDYFDKPAMAVMLAGLAPDSYRILSTVTDKLDQALLPLADWAAEEGPILGIVHGDARNRRIGALIAGLAEALPGFLVGGLTVSESGDQLQIAGKVTGGGLSGLLLSASVPAVVGVTQGCVPIGPAHSMTEGNDTIVMALDGRRALDVLLEDLGEGAERNLRRKAAGLHVALPVRGSDTGDFMVRNIVSIDTIRGWVTISDELSISDRVLFVRRDAQAARDDLKRMLGEVTRRVGGPVKGALYYSCVARGPNLFGEEDEEIGLLREALGDVPLIGLYAGGEISHDRLYQYSGVLTLFP